MNKKSGTSKDVADRLVKGIKRKTRKQYSAEEKFRIVLAGLRGKENEPCCAIGPSDHWRRVRGKRYPASEKLESEALEALHDDESRGRRDLVRHWFKKLPS